MEINLLYDIKRKILSVKKTKNTIIKIITQLFKKNIKDLELNFLFTNNNEIKKINKKFLNKNYPTDVLCFRYDKNSADIIISIEQVIKNAKIFKVPLKEEFIFIIIHGILHFKGMKDDTFKEKKKMLEKGKKILKLLKEKEIL